MNTFPQLKIQEEIEREVFREKVRLILAEIRRAWISLVTLTVLVLLPTILQAL